ncbi:MAG: transcriptional repressor LexA [Burkholderiales bacterium]|nr:transcriptional repressor LexA [Burkholderiales bacterium]MDQ3196793.1 transcriptional repressor LexA [Pseudomonadota bacterium]
MVDVTARQAEILELISAQIEATGYPPTRAEIAQALGFRSVNAAEEHVKALVRKGLIELSPNASRGIRLKHGGLKHGAGLPVVGRVAAGQPILAEQHIEGRYQIDSALFKLRPDYLLRVRGFSMIAAGILDGDLLAVHRISEARTGQIVVARVDDEVTVKRFRRRGSQVLLLAENPDFAPIVIDLKRDSLVIEGLGVGVIRSAL